MEKINVTADEARKAQHYIAEAQEICWTLPDVPTETPVTPISLVGIVGAGTMGGGIAMNFLNAGIPVSIVETNRDALDRGLAIMRKNYDRSVSRGRITQTDVENRLALLDTSLSLEPLRRCDLVIEAVYEDIQIKKDVFARLDKIAKPGAVLATNTSYQDVDVIASATSRPEAVVGMHFFSPANVMKLLEVVRAEKTSKSVIATAMAVARRIGKIGVVVGNGLGFVGNRMLFPRQGEARKLILEGAMPWDVDRVLMEFGFRMGPFAMDDLAGLDIGWNEKTSKGETLRDLLCEAGRRGQKTNAGFYDYDDDRRAVPSAVVESIILDLSKRSGQARRSIGDDEILARCLYPMVNEGARILEEGKAIRASDIDVVWVNGFGWPVAHGGPMYWAEQIGLSRIAEKLEELAAQHGRSLLPSPLLTRLARNDEGFGL